jgi:hypothetical protein
MTKFQFLLVSALVSSVVFLFIGSRDSNSFATLLPVVVIMTLSALANRFVSEPIWEKAAIWANTTAGRRIFRTKQKRLPPSKSRRLR